MGVYRDRTVQEGECDHVLQEDGGILRENGNQRALAVVALGSTAPLGHYMMPYILVVMYPLTALPEAGPPRLRLLVDLPYLSIAPSRKEQHPNHAMWVTGAMKA